jgi:1-acyl-sn-glycerol-3-phosphate acyltransferase
VTPAKRKSPKRAGAAQRTARAPSARPVAASKPPKVGPPKRSGKAPSASQRAPANQDGFDSKFVAGLLPFLRALRGYMRLRVDGLENLPAGPAILAANHTGWLGLDYALAALVLHDEAGRVPRGLVHKAWFVAPATAKFAAKVGLAPVSKASMAQALGAGHLVMVFPEGEQGAFRPPSGYKVTEFARGFARVAAQEGVPVVPVAILGGEESNPVQRTIKSYEDLVDLRIPLPANLVPKPVKWRIRFLPPVQVAKDADAHEVASSVQEAVQSALDALKQERGHPYL